MDNANTLTEALTNLSQWVEDSAIHTERVYTNLRNIDESSTLLGDKAVLKEQICLITHGIEISDDFWMTLQQASTHLSKFHDSTAYEKLRQNLMDVAAACGDVRGRGNYAPTLL